MRPILISRGSIRIASYPAMLYAGLLFGILAQNYQAHAARLDALSIWIATLLLLPCALVGARALHVATHWSAYRDAPLRIWDRSRGGLAMFGALPAMLIASIPVLALVGVSFWAFWDVAVFCILVGMVFARVGCLLTGCCSGRPTDGRFGLMLRDHHGIAVRRVPMQLLEAGLAILLLVGAAVLWPRVAFHGELFLGCLTAYAIGRCVLQLAREERTRFGRFDLQQAIALGLALGGLAALILMGS